MPFREFFKNRACARKSTPAKQQTAPFLRNGLFLRSGSPTKKRGRSMSGLFYIEASLIYSSSTFSSRILATLTILVFLSKPISFTPEVTRPISLISCTRRRIITPASVMSIRS